MQIASSLDPPNYPPKAHLIKIYHKFIPLLWDPYSG